MKLLRIAIPMLVAMVGLAWCSARKPAKASVPVTMPPTVTSIEEAAPVGEPSAGSAESAAATEPGLRYERVVVPPLRPGVPVGEEAPAQQAQQPTRVTPTPSPARRPVAGGSVRTQEAEAPTDAEAAKPADVRAPLLKPMLSDAERRQLDSQINTHLDRARRNFSQIREARLGTNERAVLDEARSFAARADQLRGSDPVLANSLAERSAILTQELLRKQ